MGAPARPRRIPWVVRCENPACDWDDYEFTEEVDGWPQTEIANREPFFCPHCGYPAVRGAGVYRMGAGRTDPRGESTMKIHSSITLARVLALAAEDDYIGVCVHCGAETSGVEPDAREYPCLMCGHQSVFGAEQIAVEFNID